ncbi:MAG TPA: hypothetical protein PLE77_05455 [Kiritimatiellia bacterium]|nr:hypothetical protein [Kiritimatiellia bacterium]
MCSLPGKQPANIRDTLFGDLPFSEWPNASVQTTNEPWTSFAAARACLKSGDKFRTIQLLQQILGMPALESRHYLQAWHFLRELGLQPGPKVAKYVYGVMVEVSLEQGLDIVAAYADHSARYFNYSGAAVIWEAPDHTLDAQIDELLGTAKDIVDQIGPWGKARPPAPARGHARINILTPSGLHFGEGPFNKLAADGLGGPVIETSTHLMLSLMAMSEQKKA